MDDRDKTREELLKNLQELKQENDSLKVLYNNFVSMHKRMEDTLIKSKVQFKDLSIQLEAILDHIPALVFYKDKNNNFIRVNKYLADAHGKTKKELEGRNLAELYSSEVAKKYYQDDLPVINSGVSKLNIIEQWETADGLKWVSTSKLPFVNAKGEIIGIIGLSLDITELKQKKEALVFSNKKLLESLKEVSDYKYAINQSSTVEITDSKGKILFANENFCKLSKYSEAELEGQDHRIMFSGYHPKSFFTELWNTIISGEIWKGEIMNKAKDGSLYWVDTVIVPFLDENGKPRQYMVFRNDITERKYAETKVQQQNKQLYEIAFLQSHIVRRPIASLLGVLNLIKYDNPSAPLNFELIPKLGILSKELDNVIHEIVKKTAEIEELK